MVLARFRCRRRQCPVDARAGGGDASLHHDSDYVNRIGLETDEGSERITAAYRLITNGISRFSGRPASSRTAARHLGPLLTQAGPMVRIRLPPAASHTNSIIVTGLCESLENRRTIDEIDSTLTAKGPVGAPVKAPAV
jgi:hypothetical protein